MKPHYQIPMIPVIITNILTQTMRTSLTRMMRARILRGVRGAE